MRSGFVLALLLLAAPILGVGADGTVDVYFLDVGQGDAILIDMGELEVLIDGGPGAAVADLLMPYVDGALEMIFLTHAHTDHYGGLDDVLEHFQVLEVLTSQHHPSKTTYNAFLADVAAEGAIRTEVSRGDTVTIGGALLHVLHPLMIGSEENPNSLVLQLSYGEIDFLFTGDLEESAEHELVLAVVLQDIDILKVAHHGSRYGSTQASLDLVKPEIAIYSAGAGNVYGHPHDEALDRLCGIDTLIYGTDLHGTVTVSTDGEEYSVSTATEQQPIVCEAPPPPPGSVSLEVDPVAATGQGSYATVTAHTAPGANCSLAVYYKSGKSTAAGLGAKVADTAGNVSWTWKVGARTTPGRYRIVVTASTTGGTTTETVYFEVLDTGNPG